MSVCARACEIVCYHFRCHLQCEAMQQKSSLLILSKRPPSMTAEWPLNHKPKDIEELCATVQRLLQDEWPD
jgi:hypothetical protein